MEPNECFLSSCQQLGVGEGLTPSRRIANTHADTHLHALVTKTQTHAESLEQDLLQEQRFLQTDFIARFCFSANLHSSKCWVLWGKMARFTSFFITLCTFSPLAWMVWSVCVPQHAVSYYTCTLSFNCSLWGKMLLGLMVFFAAVPRVAAKNKLVCRLNVSLVFSL